MFESSYLLRLARPALDGTIPLQSDYNDCWQVLFVLHERTLTNLFCIEATTLLCRVSKRISRGLNDGNLPIPYLPPFKFTQMFSASNRLASIKKAS
jgi:hypothetical protein